MPLPTIVSGNVASATAAVGFNVDNSCRFNLADSAYMHKTPSTGDRRKWTLSMWVKLGAITGSRAVFGSKSSSGNYNELWFQCGDDGCVFRFDQQTSGSPVGSLITNRVFRDPSAWYHIVCVWDSDNSTAGDRMKMYINGVEPSFGTDTNPALNLDSYVNSSSYALEVGAMDTDEYFDGYLAEVVFCDGQAYAASDFGEFDEDSPTIWKPKKVSTLTFGTNGFYLDFKDSANLGNDANGGTDLTEVNLAAADQAVDTPTNNFATLNPLSGTHDNRATYSEGNCKMVTVASGYQQTQSTIGVAAGKWYAECIFLSQDGGAASPGIHAGFSASQIKGNWLGYESGYGYGSMGTTVYHDSSSSSWGSTAASSANDILGIALDLDNKKIYWSVNGTWQNSSDPAANSNGFTVDDDAINTELGFYFFEIADLSSTRNYTYAVNFGGCPGWTLSSAQSDGNGYGRFEFSPPDSFLSLCSKNLGSDGG